LGWLALAGSEALGSWAPSYFLLLLPLFLVFRFSLITYLDFVLCPLESMLVGAVSWRKGNIIILFRETNGALVERVGGMEGLPCVIGTKLFFV
jgi:hypothetical protein